MTIRKLSHKTIALIILTFFIILSLFVGSTLAYVAIKKKADNVFSVGLVELTVEEDSFPKDEFFSVAFFSVVFFSVVLFSVPIRAFLSALIHSRQARVCPRFFCVLKQV